MERAVQSEKGGQQQSSASPGARRNAARSFAPRFSRLGQLADTINSGPRVQSLAQLKEDIEGSPRVENLRQLAGQMQAGATAQLEELPASAPNRTGLPDQLKSGVESLSGLSLDDVKVHYNSAKPAQLNALAYAQGTDIHVAPGQEKHVPHEAWHIVQQKQGRVQPTRQMKDRVPVNDDQSLEREADVIGAKAATAPVQRLWAVVKPMEPGETALTGDVGEKGSTVQLVSVKHEKSGTVLQVEMEDEKVSLFSGRTEVGSVTFENIGQGIISQKYIDVKSDHQGTKLSYVLVYLSARANSEATLLYLGGGSLSPSGSLVAGKFGFRDYAPKEKKEKSIWSKLCCCFTGGGEEEPLGGEDQPLIENEYDALLRVAYGKQREDAGGNIPPIKWLPVSEILKTAAAKVKEAGWTVID